MIHIQKPAFPTITTDQLKADLGQLKEAIDSSKKKDGTVDVATIRDKIDGVQNPGLRDNLRAIESWFQRLVPGKNCGGGCGGSSGGCGGSCTVAKKPETLKADEVISVLDALLLATSTITSWDNNGDGIIQREERDAAGTDTYGKSGFPLRHKKLAVEVVQGASAEYMTELSAWRSAILRVIRDKRDRPALDDAFVRRAREHAATERGAEAIAWSFRELAVRGKMHAHWSGSTKDLESSIDEFLESAETSFLKHIPLFGRVLATYPGHLDDREIARVLKTEDLDEFIADKKKTVAEEVTDFAEYLAGTDLPDVSHYENDPDIRR